MRPSAGQRLGAYEIVAQLGAGGMGEVYRARDSRLKRDVAIKVLPADVAGDRERLARFQREAEVLASLNHPHIAHVYGIEDGALVMELVEGDDLSQLIARGPIPIDEALSIAKQIAEALEAAHEAGIVHRDLKPGNVKVTHDGTVKVLDFGLAKPQDLNTSGPQGLSNSPTMTSPAMTMRGVILGTAAYMAPEQAKGKPVDRRADIWAFGCVLYEMLTAKRAFNGEDATDTIAEVLKSNVDWLALPENTPASIRVLLRRCLEKDPRKRAPHISIGRLAIDDASTATGELVRAAEPSRGLTMPIAAIVGMTALVALAAGWVSSRYLAPPPSATSSGEPMRFPLPVPDDFLRIVTRPSSMALSNDGARLAFMANNNTSRLALLVRDMSTIAPKVLQLRNENLAWPTWSPDGRYLAVSLLPFGRLAEADTSQGGVIRRIDPSGGPATTITEWGRYPIWGSAGVIVYSGQDGRIYRVSEGGGGSAPVTTLDKANGEVAHLPMSFFPDGRRFIYAVLNKDIGRTGTIVASIDGGAPSALGVPSWRLALAGEWLWYLADSGLQNNSGMLMAQRIDPSTLRLDGGPITVAENVANFAVSPGGTLVIVPRDSIQVKMAWLNGQGAAEASVGDAGGFASLNKPDLSPDGKRMLYMRFAGSGLTDIWQADLERNVSTRVIATRFDDDAAVYTPDAKHIIYSSNQNGTYDLYRRAADGSGDEELLYASAIRKTPMTISPDGSVLLFTQAGAQTGIDIWALPLSGDRTPKPIVANRALEGYPAFSPDGRWIAYCAAEEGGEPDQVFVEPYPPTGARTRISTTEGASPRWSADGREVYYGTSGGQIMKVAVTTTGGTVRAGRPQSVVKAPQLFSHNAFVLDKQSRILALDAGTGQQREPATVVLNWQALLRGNAAQ